LAHPNSHLLTRHWNSLRRHGAVPDQTDVDPRAIKLLLPFIFILDAEDCARPFYRLAGTAVCRRYGFELKGTDFFAPWDRSSASTIEGLLRESLKLKQPVCLSANAASADRGTIVLEIVLAPLSFAGATTRFLALSQVLSDSNALGGKPVVRQRLAAAQFICDDAPALYARPPLSLLPPPAMPVAVHACPVALETKG
jgi:hypothetical protein